MRISQKVKALCFNITYFCVVILIHQHKLGDKTMKKRPLIEKTDRVVLVAVHCIDPTQALYDITIKKPRKIKRKKKEKIKYVNTGNPELTNMIDARKIPELVFLPFQCAFLHKTSNKIVRPKLNAYKLLAFLDFCGGEAEYDEIALECWGDKCSEGAVAHAKTEINTALGELEIGQFVEQNKGVFKIVGGV
jgi:hypothetical protein